jgi:hypothetical protein
VEDKAFAKSENGVALKLREIGGLDERCEYGKTIGVRIEVGKDVGGFGNVGTCGVGQGDKALTELVLRRIHFIVVRQL